ncbi:MAG: hypothetical protein HKL95_00065 [Phycisphaerae bacterium]|nr:hypothetical protein [Phycisphaerae bacterium]
MWHWHNAGGVQKHGIASIGVEAKPMAHFASAVKTTWDVPAGSLLTEASAPAQKVRTTLESERVLDDHNLPLFGNEKEHVRRKLLTLPP